MGKFVLRIAWPSKSEPSEVKDAFEMPEEHLDLPAFGLGLWVEGRFGGQPGKVTRVLMFLAANEAGVCVRAAFDFDGQASQMALVALYLRRPVFGSFLRGSE